jgi:signal transduction histidine kinase
MKSRSLSARMIAASIVLAVLVAASFAVLISAVSTLDDARVREAHSKDVSSATVLVEKLVIDIESGVRGFVLSGNLRLLRPYTQARAELPRRLDSLERLVAENPAQVRRARNLRTAIQGYIRDYADPIVDIAADNRAAAGSLVADEEGRRHTRLINSRFSELRSAEDAVAAASAASANTQSRRAVIVAISALAVCALLIVLFGLYLARSIARPVRAAATASSRLAEGDLSVRLAEDGPGEVSELTKAFNRMATELERSRADLETQNARLRESERRKSELVTIVSHELRTPLASVLGFTSLLLNRDIEEGDQRRYLEIVDLQARRLSVLLNDFLDVENLEEGRLEFARQLLDMGTVVDEQVQLFSGQSSRHTLDVELQEKPLPVRGDPNRLAQVVGNLLSNAIKYSPEGGVVKVVGERDEEFVRVSVRDQGVGIPEELQKRVFGKFFRGDAGASGIPGSGLGLTIARSVVEAHGGRMSFKSVVGKGSVFSLELPLAAD